MNGAINSIGAQAGIVIALEAGCYFTGSREFFHAHRDQEPSQFKDWEELIWGRKYIVVRYVRGCYSSATSNNLATRAIADTPVRYCLPIVCFAAC